MGLGAAALLLALSAAARAQDAGIDPVAHDAGMAQDAGGTPDAGGAHAHPAKPAAPKTPAQLELEAKLARERASTAQLAERESGLLGRLADLERQIELEGRSLRAAQARLRVANTRLAATEARVRAAEDRVDRANRALGPRLTARYRLGREAYVRFLLGAKSISEVLRRKRLFASLLARDFDALADLRLRVEEAKAARDDRVRARDELAQSAATEQGLRAALEARVQQQKRVLAAIQQEKAVHEEAVRELADAARELGQQLAELQKRGRAKRVAAAPAQASGGTAPLSIGAMELSGALPIREARGKLLFPVDGGVIEERFGRATDPLFGTVTLQRGIDVRAPEGTKVRAVYGGKVVHAGWFRGYGNLMILDHGTGLFSLMAHLATLDRAVGEEVQRGEAVGTVGDTGSLKGAYLYFELRDGQMPLDPERWLARGRKPPRPN
jgi:septal ring factor EnvC (AmiA/AmiB activator)